MPELFDVFPFPSNTFSTPRKTKTNLYGIRQSRRAFVEPEYDGRHLKTF